jgi:hypothetical protein
LSKPRVEYMPLSLLEHWPRNPKGHAEETIKESIARFGFVQPILIDEETKRIVAGHGRLEALIALKKKGEKPPLRIAENEGEWFVPVIRGIEFASEKEAEAYLLADNQTTILGGWDDQSLQAMLSLHTDDLSGLGWSPSEIEAFRMPMPEGFSAPKRSDDVLHVEWIHPDDVEQWLSKMIIGKTLNVCCGHSMVGDVRIDSDPNSSRTEAGDLFKLDYLPGSFDTVIVDPPFSYYSPKYGQGWLLQLGHIAQKRVLLSTPTFAANHFFPRFKPELYALTSKNNPYFMRLYWCFDRTV